MNVHWMPFWIKINGEINGPENVMVVFCHVTKCLKPFSHSNFVSLVFISLYIVLFVWSIGCICVFLQLDSKSSQ